MGDGSHRSANQKSLVQSLKTEWALFWESIAGENETADKGQLLENAFETGKLQPMSLDDVRSLTRALSQDRRKLNRRLESLKKEIDLNTAKLESLRLVGGEDDETFRKISELNDQGQSLSNELSKLDSQLRLARTKEEEIKRQLTPA